MNLDRSLIKDIESFIMSRVSRYKIPGLTVSITDRDDILYARGFGYSDVSSGLPANPNTLYGIGSVTKSFTALGIMKLYEEGLLDINDPIDKYVPVDIKPFGADIKIHHLLTHSSGIPALAYAEAFIRGCLELTDEWLPIIDPGDIPTFMDRVSEWIEAKPGEKFYYLNEGYVLLGLIISKVSGVRYEDYVKERIFKPLKMNDSYIDREEIIKVDRLATPYIMDKDGKLVEARYPYGITSDGGIVSNVKDLARYVRMYLNRGSLDDIQIIDERYVEDMEKPYIRVPYEYFGGESYGYGWIITPNFFNRKLVSHSGSILVHTAYVGYIQKDGIGVSILSNSANYPLSNIGLYILTRLLNEDLDKLDFIKYEDIYSKLEGTYKTYKDTMKITIKRNGSFLNLITKDRYTENILPLIPVEIGEKKAIFHTLINWRRYIVEFRIYKDRVELLYERYKLIKKAL